MEDLSQLIRALDTEDQREQRQASDSVKAAGPAALPHLVEALASGPPQVRKAAAYLLSTHKGAEAATEALRRAVVADPEPKVRQNAAVSLGKTAAESAAPDLIAALNLETVGYVRRSLLLALGAVGGDAACAALRGVTAADEGEREALRKALDRCGPRPASVEWNPEGLRSLTLLLDVPVGMEAVARAEAEERGVGPVEPVRDGRLSLPPGADPVQAFPSLRCAYGLLIEGGEGAALPPDDAERARAVSSLLSASIPLRDWRDWLRTGEDTLRYRFSLAGARLRRESLRDLLKAVRGTLAPLGLTDSPSRYDLEVVVEAGEDATRLSLKPSFMGDPRFDYRVKDVGASIQPVVAACLARLARTAPDVVVFDPTCGSGTLLIERALLDEKARLNGLDVSPTALASAQANVAAAEMSDRATLRRGDATDASAWPDCDELLANLPFGMRTRREEMDIEELYAAVLAHAAEKLRPGGRAVLYTANRRLLESALAPHRRRLKFIDRLQVESGGIRSGVWVLRKR